LQFSEGIHDCTAALLETEAARLTAAVKANMAFLMEIIFSLSKLDNDRASYQKAVLPGLLGSPDAEKYYH